MEAQERERAVNDRIVAGGVGGTATIGVVEVERGVCERDRAAGTTANAVRSYGGARVNRRGTGDDEIVGDDETCRGDQAERATRV